MNTVYDLVKKVSGVVLILHLFKQQVEQFQKVVIIEFIRLQLQDHLMLHHLLKPAGSDLADWTVIAGGAGGGANSGAGAGGAGGFRESPGTSTGSYSVSPIAGGSAITLTTQDYTITVGAVVLVQAERA